MCYPAKLNSTLLGVGFLGYLDGDLAFHVFSPIGCRRKVALAIILAPNDCIGFRVVWVGGRLGLLRGGGWLFGGMEERPHPNPPPEGEGIMGLGDSGCARGWGVGGWRR